jgi:hypothetical protein
MDPNFSKILIVFAFLGALILVRQLILTKSGVIKKTLGVRESQMALIETYNLEKSVQLSLFDVSGQRVVVLHGKSGQAGLLQLSLPANGEQATIAKGIKHV